jgi:uncharacterized hydrophobic protein (TIGR00271 family)
MSIFARFKAIDDNYKAGVVRRLMEYSTPDFAFFYLVALSVFMATLGLLDDSASIVIGSMLIAPLLYPILAMALGLVMSNGEVMTRSFSTIVKAFVIGLGLATITAFLFGAALGVEIDSNAQILARTEPTLIHVMVAIVAGLAVSFALAQPEWSETLPGIAISVALIPPLAVLGIGLAYFDTTIIGGSAVLLVMNVIGIVAAAMVSFSLMDLYQKQNIAESTIKREEEKLREEQAAIEEIEQNELKADFKEGEHHA